MGNPKTSRKESDVAVTLAQLLHVSKVGQSKKGKTKQATFISIGVREGILLGGRKKFALKITICPKNRQLALKLTFQFNPNGA